MRFSKVVFRGCLCLSIWVGSSELELAQRYFQARKEIRPLELQSVTLAPHSSRWPGVGTSWKMGVRLARPTLATRAAVARHRLKAQDQFSPDLEVVYSVIERELGPVFRWVVRLTSDSWTQGMSWEQLVLPSASQVRIRPCMGSYCGPWREWEDDAVVATAGHKDLPVGIQSHLFLFSSSLRALSRDRAEYFWRSEDFFGREQGWEWPSNRPWPARLWNAQSEVRWIAEVQK